MVLLRSECVLPPACKPLPSDQHDKARYAAVTRLCNADISGTVAGRTDFRIRHPDQAAFLFSFFGAWQQ